MLNNKRISLKTTGDGFRYAIVKDIFEGAFYEDLCIERRNLKYNKQNYGYEAPIIQDSQSAFDYFHTKEWRAHVNSVFNLPLSLEIKSECHQHLVPGTQGTPHTDLTYCYFNYQINQHGLNPHNNNSLYQKGPAELKRVRAVTCLLYFDNDEHWTEGDGGETTLFTINQGKFQEFDKAPPINNSMLIFECSPTSWHAFNKNVRHDRNSFIMWFHVTSDFAETRWGKDKIVSW